MTQRVVVLFPVGDTARVEAFRQQWDPLAYAVAAHITLAYPFDSSESAGEVEAALSPVARAAEPFAVQLRRAAVEDNEYLFLLVDEGSAAIRDLHDRLYNGPFARLVKPERFLPHMTVGRTRDAEALRRAERAAREEALSFTGEALALSVYRIDASSRVRELDLQLGSPNR